MLLFFYSLCLSVPRVLLRLGGPGLLLAGFIDNSFIPVPGAQDILTILLSAADREWWLYYAGMATLGAVMGGYATFQLGRKGGEAAFEKHVSADKAKTFYRRFKSWGWGAVVLPAILPPPFPASPFFFTAGVLNYPTRRYLGLLAAGRAVRYLVIAFLASIFGRRVLTALWDEEMLAWLGGGMIAVGLAAYAAWRLIRRKRRK